MHDALPFICLRALPKAVGLIDNAGQLANHALANGEFSYPFSLLLPTCTLTV